jgi:hypothetical protein
MICLACGAENAYPSESCAECELAFAVFPPHVHTNHICQLQDAVAHFLDGTLEKADFLEVYLGADELVKGFEAGWGPLGELHLLDRLAVPLRERYAEHVELLNEGMLHLDEAIHALNTFVSAGDAAVLAPVYELLGEGFRQVCSGCGGIMHELEMDQIRQVTSFGVAVDQSG